MTANVASHFNIFVGVASLGLLAGLGCRKAMPPGALVLTQSPVAAAPATPVDLLDLQYPPGSRIVLMEAPATRSVCKCFRVA